MSHFLLALDQSTQCSGYAIFREQELLTVGHVSPTGEYIERIVKLKQWLDKITDDLGSDFEVAIEDIQLQEFEPNGKGRSRDMGVTTFKKLAHVQGAILTLLAEKGIKYTIVPSSVWKKTCNVKGKRRDEQKKNAQDFIIDTYKIKPTQDEADAACIGFHILKNKGFDWS